MHSEILSPGRGLKLVQREFRGHNHFLHNTCKSSMGKPTSFETVLVACTWISWLSLVRAKQQKSTATKPTHVIASKSNDRANKTRKKPKHQLHGAKARRKLAFTNATLNPEIGSVIQPTAVTSTHGNPLQILEAKALAAFHAMAKDGKIEQRCWFEVNVEGNGMREASLNTCGTTLGVFHNLKDAQAVQREGRCIVEGPEPIQLLLRSKTQIVALAVRRSVLPRLEAALNERKKYMKGCGVADNIPVFVLSKAQLVRSNIVFAD